MKTTKVSYSENGLFVEESRCIRLIRFADIVFLSFDTPYVKVNLLNGDSILLYTSISKVSDVLPANFLLCNQSCIVNSKYVIRLDMNKSRCILELINGVEIYVPRRKMKHVKEWFVFFNTEEI